MPSLRVIGLEEDLILCMKPLTFLPLKQWGCNHGPVFPKLWTKRGGELSASEFCIFEKAKPSAPMLCSWVPSSSAEMGK